MSKKIIFALVGPSQSGKTTLIVDAVKLIGNQRLAMIKSFTTRYKRSEDDDLVYDFITGREFREKMDDGDVIQHVKYAGHVYGNSHGAVSSVLKNRHGILALTEEGVLNFRSVGYIVKPIKIAPKYQKGIDISELRKNEDAKRSQVIIDFDLEVINSFRRGGREKAAQKLVDFIDKF